MITGVADFEEVFGYAWRDDPTAKTPSALVVVREPVEAGWRRLLWAVTPHGSEFVPFEDGAHVREFAQAMLDLPTAAAPYRRELGFSEGETETEGAGPSEELCEADLAAGRDEARGLRPYLVYRSCYWIPDTPGSSALGLEASCRNVDVDRLHTEARALLVALGDVV
ncbi:hypothetical protein AB0D04_23360 [Streptomyces sp. NPDC048483]|uniref:hypothetical protein n=1 Tax=Streptomyces sp. NPDC048483 TaxID=3154927 RepID=UPI003442312F